MTRATQDTNRLRRATRTGLSPSAAPLSRGFRSRKLLPQLGPTTPRRPEPPGFGLFPGRSPLLGESLLFSLPAGTKMFQFPAFASTTKGGYLPFRQVGCPIRESRDQWSLAPAPGLSQLITPFIACESLGIRRTPLLPFSHTDPPGTPEGQSILSDGPAPQKLRRGVRLSSTSCPTCQRTTGDGLGRAKGGRSGVEPHGGPRAGRRVPCPCLWEPEDRQAGQEEADREGRTDAPTRCADMSAPAFTLLLQKGGVPAAPSGTATLLRLSPNHRSRPRPILAATDFRRPRLSWLDGRCVQGPGTYSPRHG